MPRFATVAPYLDNDDLERRYRQAHDPVARSHWHLLWLVATGRHVPEVATLVGYSPNWVRTIIRRYNADGAAGIVDRRGANPGARPLLTPELRAELQDALVGPAPDGGLWTGPKVAAWMTDRLGRPVGLQRGWEALRARLHAPTAAARRHHGRSRRPDGVQKGGLQARIDTIRRTHPTAHLTVWAEDEHRLGLLPVVRRVWAPRGQRPVAWVHRRYQWLYVYAFVRPTTGQSWWCLLPTVSTTAMTVAVAAFAHDEGIDATHRAVLVLDGAGWHTSGELVVPEGVDLVFLPPASPALQPVERVWMLVDEPVANRTFADLDALEDVLVTRCQTLRADRRRIQAHTRFQWWPHERRPRNPQ